jgi:outer membrane lipoprotein LolB
LIPARSLTLVAALWLAGCATSPKTDGGVSQSERTARYESRAAVVESLDHWALDGRLAVSDGEDGGSGQLEWRNQPGLSELDFRGALGRGAWQLDIQPHRAVLNLANGETWQAADVSTLVRDHVGWDVPVDSLSWWVRGLAAPGPVDQRHIDVEGRITLLSQNGWDVEYKKYKEFSGLALPTRLDARSGRQHVKFIMRDWTIPVQSENDPQ